MTPRIIFEDNSILVVDKPSGWIVNDASTAKGQPVIQTWLSNNFNYPIAKDVRLRSGIVHRLDKETSGVLIIAKTQEAMENLQSQFKSRVTKKEYTALVHGRLEPETGTVEAPVGRLPWNRKRFGVLAGGREAKTSWKVNKYYKKDQDVFSLVTLFPKTGRTHQIRIHLKYLRHPVVSDEFYAGRKTARNDRVWCPRLFLHASELSILHPEDKNPVSFISKLPLDLKKVVGKLS